MGCLCTRDVESENESDYNVKKKYSWDKRKETELDECNFIIDNLVNEERIETPGSINGHQFLIQNCKDSTIYLLDHMNTITIYDCFNCKIILGPVKGSVYIGGCINCVFVVACGQFRIRDSRKVLAFLHCETQPVIEASSGVLFGSYNLSYKEIDNHAIFADLNVKRKNWKVVHDFTPLQSESNWKFIENDNAHDYVKEPISSDVIQKLRLCDQSWTCQKSSENTNKHPVADG